MISAPRAQILTDADCAGGTSYKTQEKMKLIFFFFFSCGVHLYQHLQVNL